MSKVTSPYGDEPKGITPGDHYNTRLAVAFNWYNQEKDKKDARNFLRYYIQSKNKTAVKLFDQVPDQKIDNTFGWLSRLVMTGSVLSPEHQQRLDQYTATLLNYKPKKATVSLETIKRPHVRENMEEKVKEYLGNLEGELDTPNDLNLFQDLQLKNIPAPYLPYLSQFIARKASEFIDVYESDSPDIKEGYSNFNKRRLTSTLKLLAQWKEDIAKYEQFKKANRKPKARKTKSPVEQVSKLKFLKESPELEIKSIQPTELVGASQIWIYNTKYKRLSVYRSESSQGIQVKGTILQNYDPEICEQKALRKPKEVLKKVLDSGKVQLRKILSELNTKDLPVNGRINEECLLIRAVK